MPKYLLRKTTLKNLIKVKKSCHKQPTKINKVIQHKILKDKLSRREKICYRVKSLNKTRINNIVILMTKKIKYQKFLIMKSSNF